MLENKGLKGRLSPKDPTIALFYSAGSFLSHLTLLIGNFVVRFISGNSQSYKMFEKTNKDYLECIKIKGVFTDAKGKKSTSKMILSNYDSIMNKLVIFHCVCLLIFVLEFMLKGS